MFYISGDITIKSPLRFEEAAVAISRALEIPPLVKDVSGRWEESKVFISKCFGMQFMFCEVNSSKASTELNEYGLSIDSNLDVQYDGTEKEIDATKYAVLLLEKCHDLTVTSG